MTTASRSGYRCADSARIKARDRLISGALPFEIPPSAKLFPESRCRLFESGCLRSHRPRSRVVLNGTDLVTSTVRPANRKRTHPHRAPPRPPARINTDAEQLPRRSTRPAEAEDRTRSLFVERSRADSRGHSDTELSNNSANT